MQPTFTTRPDIRGTFGAVATTHWLATQTGMAVLERGGNAFDAAAAAGFVLQIVEPHLNGPGGELPAIVMRAGADAPEVICGQGPFPAAASAERLRGMGLAQMPGTGLLPGVVPGAFDGWMLLLRDYGTLQAARCALLRDRLRRAWLPAGAAHRRDDHPGGRVFPDRMAELRRGVAGQRQAAASRQAVPHAGHRRDLQAHPRRSGSGGQRSRRADRSRAACLLQGLRRRGDRPLLQVRADRLDRRTPPRPAQWRRPRADIRRMSRNRRRSITTG